jgi:hypothetical protein
VPYDEDPNGDIFTGPKELHGEAAEKEKMMTMTDGLNSNIGPSDDAIWPQSINIQVKK